MSKLYRITRNPEQLSLNIDDPSGHDYDEYISLNDPDPANPLSSDYGSADDDQAALADFRLQFNQEPAEYLKAYYERIKHPQDLDNAKQRETETLNQYEQLKNAILPALVVVECSFELKVKII